MPRRYAPVYFVTPTPRPFTAIDEAVGKGIAKGVACVEAMHPLPETLRHAIRGHLQREVVMALCEVLAFDDPTQPESEV